MARVQFFDAKTIENLTFPSNEIGNLAQHYLKPLILNGSKHYFSNINTHAEALVIDDIVLPLIIADHIDYNAYVCSFHTLYVQYGLEIVKELRPAIFYAPARWILKGLGRFLKWGQIDRVVYVNNWLLPTNLYPPLADELLEDITQALVQRFPSHAIAFRSLSSISTKDLEPSLKKLGYDCVLSRDIYYTDGKDPEPFQARMTKSDLKLLKNSPYTLLENEEIPESAIPRLADLYRMLNIEKHSHLNPQYTNELIAILRKAPGFTLKAFERDGIINGLLGYFEICGTITSPMFGYDTSLPQEEGIYRKISALLLKDAKEKECLLHQSSGAGHFKTLRRAQRTLEFTGIYSKHLSLKNRCIWKSLSLAVNGIGKPLLSRFKS